MFADEELVMELLINAGQARSDAMEANGGVVGGSAPQWAAFRYPVY